MRYVDGMMVNQKRILRIMREAQLLVKPNLSIKASRVMKPKPKPTRPNEWWGIDMTKVMTLHGGWVYIVVVLDWHTKKVVGHYASSQHLEPEVRVFTSCLTMVASRHLSPL